LCYFGTCKRSVFCVCCSVEVITLLRLTQQPRDNFSFLFLISFFLFIKQVLLRRSGTPEGKYVYGIGSSFDQDLFLIIWGPTVAALSYVYDNGLEKGVVQKAIVGFRY